MTILLINEPFRNQRGVEMDPFRPGYEWQRHHWYTREPMSTPWRVTAVIAGLATWALAAWLG
jgi:hypothetical protein